MSNGEQKLKFPWYKTYELVRGRCRTKSNKAYHSYGGSGIELRMKPRDFRSLWLRDKAEDMISPSIDRIDPWGHYEISNCRYIEFDENVRRAKRKVWVDE